MRLVALDVLIHAVCLRCAGGVAAQFVLWGAFVFGDVRHDGTDFGSLAGLRLDGEGAVDEIYAFLHTDQT